jgi:hypothetical protein
MASSFPGAIDSFTDPLSGSALNSPSHSAQHADLNDAAEKIETYMGLVKVIPTAVSNGTLSATGTVTIGSAVSTVTVTNAFSALYDNYKILIQNTNCSTLCAVRLQLSSSTGSTYSTANMNIPYSSATITTEVASNTTLWSIGTGQGLTSVTLDLISPFLATDSQVMAQSATDTFVSWRSGRDSADISNATFILSLTGGTMTGGTIRVYGYRN